MKTYMASDATKQQKWFIVDAAHLTLGRLASKLAFRLRGKHKAEFTPHVDCGDFFVVINVEKLQVTGQKVDDHIYHRHSNRPGGLKTETFKELQARDPGRILMLAVEGMLPDGPLGRRMLKKLKVFAGTTHEHTAQQPEPITL